VDSTYQLNLFYLKNSTSPVVEEFLHTFSSEAYQRALQQTR
jgi:hypothetical protein